MRTSVRAVLCGWLAIALLLVGTPSVSEGRISESSSEGAVLTVALFATIVGVLFIIGFKADMDNIFSQRLERDAWARAALEPGESAPLYEPVAPAELGWRWAF